MTLLASRPTTSPHLALGPESGDHLSVHVLRRLHPHAVDADAGWLVCPVHVHVGGFSGDVAVALRVEELHRFGEALRTVRSGLRRSAVLESGEQWIDLTVTREVDGSLAAVGHLADEPGSDSRLRFRIGGLDAADLDAWIDACADATARYPLPASA
ncbi:WapI family immunity protein [Nocardioides sp. GXQ0305]|uniref:WapI family immunity protein n=1 Tax=Nocardioides sp. GXQ0305 TaxID=3423912 RepID=UPI003D7E3E54